MSSSNTELEHNYNNLEPTARKGDEEESTIQSEAPDGGSQAWLVAAGAGCAFFAGLGFANSFGVFQEYYMAHQLHDKSPDDIAWIGSLNAFLQFVGGAVGGPLADRFGVTVVSTLPYTHVIFPSSNNATDNQACRDDLPLLNHDDKPLQIVLAVYACAGCSYGTLNGSCDVSSNSSSIAILRQEACCCSGNSHIWIIYWRDRLSNRYFQDAE